MKTITTSQDELIAAALRAARDTKALIIGTDVVEQCAAMFAAQFGSEPAVIVADANTFAAAGRRVIHAFKAAGRECLEPFVFDDPALYAEHTYVERLTESL